MQAVTAAMMSRFSLGLAWASSRRGPRRKRRNVHCCRGRQSAGCPGRLGRAGLKCPLDVLRAALADVGQRGQHDRGRLGDRVDRPIADRRRFFQPEMDVQVAEQHRAERVLEQVDLAVRSRPGPRRPGETERTAAARTSSGRECSDSPAAAPPPRIAIARRRPVAASAGTAAAPICASSSCSCRARVASSSRLSSSA